MQSMAIRDLISVVFRVKGEYFCFCQDLLFTVCVDFDRFGWANASYLCGLELMNTHMIRALGVCAPYKLLYRQQTG